LSLKAEFYAEWRKKDQRWQKSQRGKKKKEHKEERQSLNRKAPKDFPITEDHWEGEFASTVGKHKECRSSFREGGGRGKNKAEKSRTTS